MPGLKLFGVHIPTFTMMDMALWPQTIMLTLILKAHGSDTWNSFKATKGHLLEGLPMMIPTSGMITSPSSSALHFRFEVEGYHKQSVLCMSAVYPREVLGAPVEP